MYPVAPKSTGAVFRGLALVVLPGFWGCFYIVCDSLSLSLPCGEEVRKDELLSFIELRIFAGDCCSSAVMMEFLPLKPLFWM